MYYTHVRDKAKKGGIMGLLNKTLLFAIKYVTPKGYTPLLPQHTLYCMLPN